MTLTLALHQCFKASALSFIQVEVVEQHKYIRTYITSMKCTYIHGCLYLKKNTCKHICELVIKRTS